MKPVVHLPIDFEQRDDVRTLGMIFRRNTDRADASLCVLRLWLEWARVGVEWRPLHQARCEGERDWTSENMSYLLSESCGWSESPAVLMLRLIEAGVLVVVAKGELDGLVLKDFSTLNPHLLPGFKSIHSKGGHAKAEKQRADEVQQLAIQQAKVLRQQGLELFAAEQKVSEEEQRKCIALVMGFDGVFGRQVRAGSEYVSDQALMRDALHVLRGHAWEDIVVVQRYVRLHRHNPEVVKDTGALLRAFDDYLGKAKL